MTCCERKGGSARARREVPQRVVDGAASRPSTTSLKTPCVPRSRPISYTNPAVTAPSRPEGGPTRRRCTQSLPAPGVKQHEQKLAYLVGVLRLSPVACRP